MKPGVVVLPNTPSVQHPVISDPALASLVKVSGFDINGMRVSYTAADDTLSIGIEQPLSQQSSHPGPVIAGDSDNNGNDGTVNPAVTTLVGTPFKDFQDFGGSEFMAAFLDIKGLNFGDVVAGFAVNDPRSPKEYQVARAVPESTPPPTALDFGTGQVQQPGTVYAEVPGVEGNVYKVNSQQHPNLEFSITHFSQLYLQETGKALTASSVIGMGATAGSGDDPGIGEAYFPEQKFTLGQITVPPTVCPPASPPVIINPHENQHINTAHSTLFRVNVLGSSGFDVSKIEPNTVTLGGAHPVFSFDRFINKDNWPDATFVFRGSDVHLPSGFTNATVSGNLTDGTTFSSSVRVFNRDSSFYTPSAVQSASARQAARAADGIVVAPNSPVAIAGTASILKQNIDPPGSPNAKLVNSTLQVDYTTSSTGQVIASTARQRHADPALKVDYTTPRSGAASASASRHSIKAQHHAAAHLHSQPEPAGKVVSIKTQKTSRARLSTQLQRSLNHYTRKVGAVNVSTGEAIGGASVSPNVVATTTAPRTKVKKVHAAHHETSTPIGQTGLNPAIVRQSGAVNLSNNTPIGNGAL